MFNLKVDCKRVIMNQNSNFLAGRIMLSVEFKIILLETISGGTSWVLIREV